LVHIQLADVLFKKENDEFILKTVNTADEGKELIESGFEYVCEINNIKAFLKQR